MVRLSSTAIAMAMAEKRLRVCRRRGGLWAVSLILLDAVAIPDQVRDWRICACAVACECLFSLTARFHRIRSGVSRWVALRAVALNFRAMSLASGSRMRLRAPGKLLEGESLISPAVPGLGPGSRRGGGQKQGGPWPTGVIIGGPRPTLQGSFPG